MLQTQDHGIPGRALSRIDTRERQVSALGYGSVRSPARIDDPDFVRQEEVIESFCEHREWRVVALLRDVEPRKTRTPGRPSLLHAMELLGRGEASCLVAAELSRLCPSVAELGSILEAIEGSPARFVSLNPPLDTGTPVGRVISHALKSVSAWERTRRADRTSAARSKRAIQRTIPPALRRRIVRMRRAGLTLQAIADDLNDDGVPTVRGGATWRPSSVQAALGYRRPEPWAFMGGARGSGA